MQNVVLELREDQACVLAKDGIVRIIDNKNYQVGQVLELSEELLAAADAAHRQRHVKVKNPSAAKRTVYRRAMSIAASLVLLLGAGGAATAYAAPFSTVTLDVNPSLSYKLNAFDRVLSMDSYNDDGEEVVEQVKAEVKGKKIEKAIAITLDALSQDAYITETETPAVVTVSSTIRNSENVRKELVDSIEAWNEAQLSDTAKKDAKGTVKPTAVVIDRRLKREARDKQVSPGKLYMAEQLNSMLPEDQQEDEDELMKQSVGDLQDKIQQYQNSAPSDSKSSGADQKSGGREPTGAGESDGGKESSGTGRSDGGREAPGAGGLDSSREPSGAGGLNSGKESSGTDGTGTSREQSGTGRPSDDVPYDGGGASGAGRPADGGESSGMGTPPGGNGSSGTGTSSGESEPSGTGQTGDRKQSSGTGGNAGSTSSGANGQTDRGSSTGTGGQSDAGGASDKPSSGENEPSDRQSDRTPSGEKESGTQQTPADGGSPVEAVPNAKQDSSQVAPQQSPGGNPNGTGAPPQNAGDSGADRQLPPD